uniref:(northern house mosquito) hypothetical protein n=1 Tax=Culex pipiens TaxID=7175 RepID=A0A8D8J830_CULPI
MIAIANMCSTKVNSEREKKNTLLFGFQVQPIFSVKCKLHLFFYQSSHKNPFLISTLACKKEENYSSAQKRSRKIVDSYLSYSVSGLADDDDDGDATIFEREKETERMCRLWRGERGTKY